MLEDAFVAFATFFATIGPPDIAIVFATLTLRKTARERMRLAAKATFVAMIILLFFSFLGKPLLAYLGISLAAMRTAGGILLLLIAIDMVFARSSGATSATDDEKIEAADSDDISVFPMATPLIAGPGAIGAAILLVAETEGDPAQVISVVAALISVLVLTFVLMIAASQVQKVLGVTGSQVVMRVMGILLAALAVQFFFDGVSQSGILG